MTALEQIETWYNEMPKAIKESENTYFLVTQPFVDEFIENINDRNIENNLPILKGVGKLLYKGIEIKTL